MVDKRYGIPFVAALVLNLVYWGVVGDWFSHIKPPETQKKDLVINLDMGQQEPPQEKKDPEKLKIHPDDKPVAGGGKAGSVLPDLSGKPTEGLKNLNPYLGGNETASVNLNGNTDNPVGNLGSGNVPGPGGGNAGNGGLSEEGNGSKGGDPGPGDVERRGGSYDSSGYIARVESNKVMPQQAVRRGLSGRVSFEITFDADGNFAGANMIGSSGSSILDNAASSLVESSGGIENTTGEPVTIVVNVDYGYN
ncbi:TonB family protein [Veillonella parvula DSM 2008]|uniref:energy transducer TonB n=1 Tax=Veillonella parvula TaxID=29466 RepID=UPI00019BFBEF|nr:TonB family protein [Veillonella parvula]ACZ23749.1 TonB family protein [Veillonella parvula DSM 2008]QQB16964.1 TonB family protein [Veillonella parvula]SNU93636.1 TonB family C-terminal domain [Veillonella parvula]